MRRQVEEEPIGVHPETGKADLTSKSVASAPTSNWAKTTIREKNEPVLLKGMEVEDLTMEMACKLLTLPRTLGEHPETGSRSGV
jgi:DNA topoisomerase I